MFLLWDFQKKRATAVTLKLYNLKSNIMENSRLTTKNRVSSDIAEQIRGWGLLHTDVGEEFLASILQAGSEDVDHIIDNEKAVVISPAVIDSDGGILLVMTLDV